MSALAVCLGMVYACHLKNAVLQLRTASKNVDYQYASVVIIPGTMYFQEGVKVVSTTRSEAALLLPAFVQTGNVSERVEPSETQTQKRKGSKARSRNRFEALQSNTTSRG